MLDLKREVELAQLHFSAIAGAQKIADVGLGASLLDVVAAGVVRSSATGEPVEMGDAFDSFHYARWHEGGVPRVRLSHGLATQLAMTDPNGVSADEIHLPFPVFSVELPFPGGPIVVDHPDGSVRDIMVLYVSSYLTSPTLQRVDDSDANSWRDVLRRLAREKSRHDWTTREIHVCMRTKDELSFHCRTRLEEAVEIGDDSLIEIGELTRRALVLAWRIVVNLALYIKHCDSRASASGGKVVNHDHGLQSKVFEFGSEVSLERDLRASARSFCMTGEKHGQWELQKRFIVRGHWKQQRVGPEGARRKLIFVEPYWKGPPDAPVLARVHKAGA